MAESDPAALKRTPLYDWHVHSAARIVAFGGWSMPLHYAPGVVREHIATRTSAGLFDVSHMGRLRVCGRNAQAFLGRVLTNDASALAPEQAHYTLVANEQGGAVDDAYLYRLTAEDFMLVVNASNRDRVWAWLHAQAPEPSVLLKDESEALAMFALQGPRSASLLAAAVDGSALPEARRNRVRIGKHDGHALIVARTGYTGEAVGFELFVDTRVAVALWQRLVDAGATPAGLGARDTLRLEAGLPLYGHELGTDRAGGEIPIFANRLARYGVRRPGNGRYVGVEALDTQRGAYEAIAAGSTDPVHRRTLPQWVQPLAVFAGRRPLRAGYELFLDDEPVGYVTSGSSVPVAGAEGERATRPIGLALVRSGLDHRSANQALDVRDTRATLMQAHLVAANLPPPAAPEGSA